MSSRRTRSRTPTRGRRTVRDDVDDKDTPSPSRSRSRTPLSSRKREFGDQMALAGEVSHIPTIIVIMYGVIGAYAWLTSYVTNCSLWTIPLYYLAGMIAFYLWHTMAHSHWSKKWWTPRMYELHMEHHLKRFPPSNFYGTDDLFEEMYPKGTPTIWNLMDVRETTANDFAHEGPIYIMMVVILALGYLVADTSLATLGMVVVGYAVMGTLGNAMHMSFHVRNFHLEKYAWYRELRMLHYCHHLGDMKSNLAMVNLGMDALFKSMVLDDPLKIKAAERKHKNLAKEFGVSPSELTKLQQQHAGFSAMALGFDLPLEVVGPRTPASARGYPTVLLRLLLLALFVKIWLYTEARMAVFLKAAPFSSAPDVGFDLFEGVVPALRSWDAEFPAYIMTASALFSEVSVTVLMAMSVLGKSFRPIMGLFLAFSLRALIRYTNWFPMPQHQLWTPDLIPFPALWTCRETANVFFSGRVALATIVTTEALRWNRGSALAIVMAFTPLVCTVVMSLAFQLSWTADIVVAIVFARYASHVATRLSKFVDAFFP